VTVRPFLYPSEEKKKNTMSAIAKIYPSPKPLPYHPGRPKKEKG
jgi:hypothetical protein